MLTCLMPTIVHVALVQRFDQRRKDSMRASDGERREQFMAKNAVKSDLGRIAALYQARVCLLRRRMARY